MAARRPCRGVSGDHRPGRYRNASYEFAHRGLAGDQPFLRAGHHYQILELLKIDGLRLFHRDLPFFRGTWSRDANSAGFPAEAQRAIDALAPPGDLSIDCVYRIASPVPVGDDADRRRTLTFMVTEMGLTQENFAVRPIHRNFFAREANLFITPTRWSRDRIIEFGFIPEKVAVVPHGVDSTIFRPLTAEQRIAN